MSFRGAATRRHTRNWNGAFQPLSWIAVSRSSQRSDAPQVSSRHVPWAAGKSVEELHPCADAADASSQREPSFAHRIGVTSSIETHANAAWAITAIMGLRQVATTDALTAEITIAAPITEGRRLGTVART